MDTSINYQMCVPFWDGKEHNAPLYKCWGYVNEDQAPLEVKPVWGDDTNALFGIVELLSEYSNLLKLPYEESGEDWCIWHIGDDKLVNTRMGMWDDDYFCIGDYYDVDHEGNEKENKVEYVVTYLCRWMISRDLYNKLLGYLNK